MQGGSSCRVQRADERRRCTVEKELSRHFPVGVKDTDADSTDMMSFSDAIHSSDPCLPEQMKSYGCRSAGAIERWGIRDR